MRACDRGRWKRLNGEIAGPAMGRDDATRQKHPCTRPRLGPRGLRRLPYDGQIPGSRSLSNTQLRCPLLGRGFPMRPLQNDALFRGSTLLGLLLAGCTATIGRPGNEQGAGGAGAAVSGGVPGAGGRATGSAGVGVVSGGGGAGGFGPVVGAGGTGSGPGTTAGCDGLTGRRIRSLTIREYANVVADLLGPTTRGAVTAALPPDNLITGFDNQGNQAPWSQPSLQESVSNLAFTLASQANPTTLAPCTTAGGSAACLQTFIRSFGNKAYGRPMAEDEFMRANAAASMGQDYATSVRLVVELVLQSPHTLYVSELGAPTVPAAPGKPIALTPYEIASQLSLLLTGGRPDATLLKAAETTGFAKPADIVTEAQRLLATAPAKAALSRFITGWMTCRRWPTPSKIPISTQP
ncbi:MAG: DUF1592 domain-containing protein [Pseudomonadota bacterium]